MPFVDSHYKAQSLIETIVAIGIIIVAVVAILSLGLNQLVLGGQSAERVIATNLAREGIELVYAILNSNRLNPDQTWPYGLVNDIYIINYNDVSLIDDGDPLTEDAAPAEFSGDETIENCTNCYLCHQTNDSYTHCASEQVFRRMVAISNGDDLGGNCGDNCEKKIISTVFWRERATTFSLVLESRLTDWR